MVREEKNRASESISWPRAKFFISSMLAQQRSGRSCTNGNESSFILIVVWNRRGRSATIATVWLLCLFSSILVHGRPNFVHLMHGRDLLHRCPKARHDTQGDHVFKLLANRLTRRISAVESWLETCIRFRFIMLFPNTGSRGTANTRSFWSY